MPLVGAGAVFFAWAAVTPGGLDADGRRAGLIEAANGMTLGGVAIPYVIVALALLWTFGRAGWRWADEVAIGATEQGLRFHPTLVRRRVPWDELRDLRIRTRRQGFAEVREVVVALRGGSIRVCPFEEEGAEAFVEMVRARLRPPV